MSGFSLGGTINGAAEWLSSAPLVRGVVSNPLATALLITALAAVVALGVYHYQLKGTGVKRGARAFLYVFLVTSAVVFVHHYAMLRVARESAMQRGVREVFTGIQQSRQAGVPGAVPVVPYGIAGPGVPPAAPPPPPPPPASDVAAPGATTGGGHVAAAGERPDNVGVAADPLLGIEDVVVPAVAPPPWRPSRQK